MSRKLIFALLATIGAVYLLNALIIFFSQPVSIQLNEEAGHRTSQFGSIQIVSVNNLQSGGVGGWSRPAGGYVDMMSSEPVIYVSTKVAPDGVTQNDYLYEHEFAHIQQKELLAEKAGGYPSYWNPIQSAIYYTHLVNLNAELESLMPKVNDENGFIPFSGFESAAECFAQPYSDEKEQAFYSAPYLYPKYCNAEQKKIALSMFSGKWPQPLTVAEKAELKPVNITTTLPKKQFSDSLKNLFKQLDVLNKTIISQNQQPTG